MAGVSLNAIVGDNGIITNAIKAKELAEESERKETLDFIINEYNSDVATDTSDNSFTNFLAKMKEKGKIEDFIFYGENLIIKYGGYYYEVVEEDEYYKISKKMTEDLGSTGGTTKVVTPDNIKNAENGNLSFNDGDEFVILDNVNVENFIFDIPKNSTVTLKLLGDMVIDNRENPGKSAINLNDGAILNLFIYGNVIVNSSFGVPGEQGDRYGVSGGIGGRAGICVPETASLNLFVNKDASITCKGGNAGKGGAGLSGTYGGRWRPDGAGARNWSEIGGKGGDAGDGLNSRLACGGDGENGYDCGSIKILGEGKCICIGGAAGAVTPSQKTGSGSGSGGSGYPAARNWAVVGAGGRRRYTSTCWWRILVGRRRRYNKCFRRKWTWWCWKFS